MNETQQLLADYAENGSEAAFRGLVERYIDFVHSVAARLTGGDSHLAQDVCQTVFTDLARQARSLSRDVALGGWLHRHTCYVAANFIRGERRRQSRERQAAQMNASPDHSEANLAELAPVLDDAINQLGDEDRHAILLRFYEKRDLRSVGEAIGSSENTARMRVSRALEKLHALLVRRGVSLSVAALGTALGASAVTAAPAGLAAGICGSALATVATGSTAATAGFKIMAITKLKLGAAAVIVAGAATTFVLQNQAQSRLRETNASLREKIDGFAGLATAKHGLSNRLARASEPKPLSPEEQSELLRLRSEAGRQRRELAYLQAMAARSGGGTPGGKTAGGSASQTHLAKDAWVFSGYATPEATFQTFWWAQVHKNKKAFLDALAPQFRAQFEQQFGGKSDEEIMAANPEQMNFIAQVQGYRILKSQVGSDDASLMVYLEGADQWKTINLVRVQSDWKIR